MDTLGSSNHIEMARDRLPEILYGNIDVHMNMSSEWKFWQGKHACGFRYTYMAGLCL